MKGDNRLPETQDKKGFSSECDRGEKLEAVGALHLGAKAHGYLYLAGFPLEN